MNTRKSTDHLNTGISYIESIMNKIDKKGYKSDNDLLSDLNLCRMTFQLALKELKK